MSRTVAILSLVTPDGLRCPVLVFENEVEAARIALRGSRLDACRLLGVTQEITVHSVIPTEKAS